MNASIWSAIRILDVTGFADGTVRKNERGQRVTRIRELYLWVAEWAASADGGLSVAGHTGIGIKSGSEPIGHRVHFLENAQSLLKYRVQA
jgi:hypothetical protein